MIRVWEGDKVPITLHFRGDHPPGTKCEVGFFRYDEHGKRGKTAYHTTVQAVVTGQATVQWTTANLLEEDQLSARFHYEAKIVGKSRASDSGDMELWARQLTVLAKNVDDGDKLFVGAIFRVRYSGSPGVRRPKLHHLASTDTEGLAVELEDFEDPKIDWVAPYELVSWEQEEGRKRVAKVRKPPWRAVFKQPGEFGSPPGSKLTRRQYVNLPPVKRPHNQGHTVQLLVGADQRGAEDQEVYVEVKLTGPDGGDPSRRKEPLPELVGGLGSELFEYDFETVRQKRATKWAAHARMTKTDEFGQAYAEFALELGIAGGDTFTIKIGHTAACEDGQLVITNWRRAQYRVFHPGPGLSDFGKLSKDDEVVTEKVQRGVIAEGARVFIDYTLLDIVPYDDSYMPGIGTTWVHDAKVFGGKSGKNVFVVAKERVNGFVDQCLARHPLEPHQHPVLVVDFCTEVAEGYCRYAHAPALKSHAAVLALGGKELTLHDKSYYVLPIRYSPRTKTEGPGILELKFTLVKGGGMDSARAAITALAKKKDRTEAEELLYAFAGRGGSVWSLDDKDLTPKQQLDVQEVWVTFVNASKVKVTPDPDHPVVKRLKRLWELVPDAEIALELGYEKQKDAKIAGLSTGSRGLLVYPTDGGKPQLGDMDLTFLHELSHALGHAYGSVADLGSSYGRPVIPGVDFRKPLHRPNPTPTPGNRYVDGGGVIYYGHGHTGGHCATGCTFADAIKDDAEVELDNVLKKMKCLNNGGSPDQRTKFCDECLQVIRASEMSNFDKGGGR